MKSLLSSYTADLDDKAAAKKQKALDDARPVQEKLKSQYEKASAEVAARPKPGVAVPRAKKATAPRYIGDGRTY